MVTTANLDLSNIPQELEVMPQWVLWKWEQRSDKATGELKWTKPPYQINGQHAESDNPETWTTFDQAVSAYETGSFSGIGFVLTKDEGFPELTLTTAVTPRPGLLSPGP
jgi:putative DNA primase/helicase